MDSMDPSVLPIMSERKGSLLLRSNHSKYSRGVLDSNKWHQERESLPMDYDIAISEKKNLLRSAYKRIGTVTDGSLKDFKTTTHEALNEVKDLKDTYQVQDVHKALMTYDNFTDVPFEGRDTKRPERGYGSVLPRHPLDYRKANWNTTTNLAFQYPFEWKQKPFAESKEEPRFCRPVSEFADIDGRKVPGINTFMDSNGTVSTNE